MSGWPEGTFGLPMPKTGCPAGSVIDWETGNVFVCGILQVATSIVDMHKQQSLVMGTIFFQVKPKLFQLVKG